MIIKLTCPVCDRSEISGNLCPNCETDLSIVRILVELPSARQGVPISVLVIVCIGVIVLGMTVAAAVRFF